MKKETAEQIFQLIHAFIYDEKPVLSGSCDWDEIFYYAGINTVTGIIGYVISKYGLCESEDISEKFEKEMITTYGYQYRRRMQMEKMISVLNNQGIDHILMKGYLVKDLYPVPELRWYGDIDFVIHKEDRQNTDQLLKSLGFEVSENWEPVYSYQKDTEYYEVHTEILDSEISEGTQREYFLDIWNHVRQIKNHTYEFEKEYHFIYLIAHLAKHASKKGAGVRMYLDIALFIKEYRESLDWDYILEQLNILGLKRFFYTICTACDRWYGVKPPCSIDEINSEAFDIFTGMTLEGGTFGANTANDAIDTLKETDAYQSRIKTVLKQVFPSADEIQARYTYLQKHKWLLPFAWIDRVFRNRQILARRIHMAKEIVTVDEEEVRMIRNLNKEIGL